VITDTVGPVRAEIAERLRELPETVRLRVLACD
jgi:hypothetical protein